MKEFKKRNQKNVIDNGQNLKTTESNQAIGRWGRLHEEYLKEYHPDKYFNLILSGKLWEYLSKLDVQAQKSYDLLVIQLKEKAEISEKLEEIDQTGWIRQMNNLRIVAEEVIFYELIYCCERSVERQF